MKASVTHFSDGKDLTGEIATVYIINVEPIGLPAFTISKRYSDFAQIYHYFRDLLPADYKFPNKSLFHSNSQFTKHRRLRGFQELLALLLKHYSASDKVSDFLKPNKSLGSISVPTNTTSRNNLSSLLHDSGMDEASLRKQLGSLRHILAQIQAEHLTIVPYVNQVNENNKEEVFRLTKIAAQIGVGSYFLAIVLNLVDVSQDSYPRIFMTAFAFTLLVLAIFKNSKMSGSKVLK
jgi:hypothetical protein